MYYNQGRIYYEAKEAGASGPGAGGGLRADFPANFVYIYTAFESSGGSGAR